MKRLIAMLVVATAIAACDDAATERVLAVQDDAFTGTWRSVTPNLEFMRFTVQPKSSEQGALAARLTFSGVYWDGSGRVDGDSLVLQMMVLGDVNAPRTIIARVRVGGGLQATLSSESGPFQTLDFVRDTSS